VGRAEEIVQRLRPHLGAPLPAPGDEYRFNSPFNRHFRDPTKKDTGGHLYVNPVRGKFICYKSDLRGGMKRLFQLLGLTYDGDEEDELPVPEMDELHERLRALDEPPADVVHPEVELPDFYEPVRYGGCVYGYLRHERGISDEDIVRYRLGQGSVVSGKDHILIIPTFDEFGRCEFWQTRRADGVSSKVKYRNPPGSQRRYHVGFIEIARSVGTTAVLTEGGFSAITTGPDAVCTYGKYVSNHQLLRLRNRGFHRIIVALDGDVPTRTIVDVASRSLGLGLDVGYIQIANGYDPDDLGRETMRRLVDAAVSLTSTDLLRLRLARL